MFKRLITTNLRQSYLKWRRTTEYLAVVREVNESGPVRYEERNAAADVENLKRMLEEKKIFNKDEMKRVLARDNRKYRKAVEKTLCRMLVHGDSI